MRRFPALILASALLVPLAACGGDDGDDDSGSSSASASGSASGTEDETTTTTEQEDDEEASAGGDYCDTVDEVIELGDTIGDDLDFTDPEAIGIAIGAFEDLRDSADDPDIEDDYDTIIDGFQLIVDAASETDGSDEALAEIFTDPELADAFEDFTAAGERIDDFTLDACGTTLDGETEDSSDFDETEDSIGGGSDQEAGDPDDPPSIDDPELESLAEDCFDGSGSACDELFFSADVGSPEEDYGDTCGGRFDESPGLCATAIGD